MVGHLVVSVTPSQYFDDDDDDESNMSLDTYIYIYQYIYIYSLGSASLIETTHNRQNQTVGFQKLLIFLVGNS